MMKRILAVIAVVFLAGCGTTIDVPVSTPPPPSAVQSPAGPQQSPVALPCNPSDSSCWVPGAGETYISYKPAHSYATASALATAAGCTVVPSTMYAATKLSVECGFNGATEGTQLSYATLFTSDNSEATLAGQMAQTAQTGGAEYAVLGPGWILGPVLATVDDTQALRVQGLTGGLVVCFPQPSAGGNCFP